MNYEQSAANLWGKIASLQYYAHTRRTSWNYLRVWAEQGTLRTHGVLNSNPSSVRKAASLILHCSSAFRCLILKQPQNIREQRVLFAFHALIYTIEPRPDTISIPPVRKSMSGTQLSTEPMSPLNSLQLCTLSSTGFLQRRTLRWGEQIPGINHTLAMSTSAHGVSLI